MGIGASLAFIAIGAILAFATHFTVSGIDIQMIGLILILVGLVGMAITISFARTGRRGAVVDVAEEEPLLLGDAEEPVTPAVQPVQQVQPVALQPTQPVQPAQPLQPTQPVRQPEPAAESLGDEGDQSAPVRGDRDRPAERPGEHRGQYRS